MLQSAIIIGAVICTPNIRWRTDLKSISKCNCLSSVERFEYKAIKISEWLAFLWSVWAELGERMKKKTNQKKKHRRRVTRHLKLDLPHYVVVKVLNRLYIYPIAKWNWLNSRWNAVFSKTKKQKCCPEYQRPKYIRVEARLIFDVSTKFSHHQLIQI